ncbi:hypothetical protein Pfo_008635 [Paulownia fortunei]|nr:hypothetical protein Pfo_008635 [Paulownia fortunei]
MSMLLAGTDTSSVTIEWAISLLLNHPHVLEKAREELETKVGLHLLIKEEDLSNLPYLRNIILETFRLFPAGPLLAIHRDPEVWDEPMSFKPERFEGKEVEAHKLLPFGMGRRACPGAGLVEVGNLEKVTTLVQWASLCSLFFICTYPTAKILGVSVLAKLGNYVILSKGTLSHVIATTKNYGLGGYNVPRGTMLETNPWAIHRDPVAWDEPTTFKPERFEGKEVETHKLMLFGMGRRAYPGSNFALSLIQCFEWEKMSIDSRKLILLKEYG